MLPFDAWTALSPNAGIDPNRFHSHRYEGISGASLGAPSLDFGGTDVGPAEHFGRVTSPINHWGQSIT
jgi:hypothetical protein